MQEGKISLEFNIVGDGREFLNFWDWNHGNDVVAEIRDNRLYVTDDDEDKYDKEISFGDFLDKVRDSERRCGDEKMEIIGNIYENDEDKCNRPMNYVKVVGNIYENPELDKH